MRKPNFGPVNRARVFSLIAILIDKANQTRLQVQHQNLSDEYEIYWENSSPITSQGPCKIKVKLKAKSLWPLIDSYLEENPGSLWGESSTAVWRNDFRKVDTTSALEVLLSDDSKNPLKDYVSNDNQAKDHGGKGDHVRRFTLTLPSKDLEKNMANLQEEVWPPRPPRDPANRQPGISLFKRRSVIRLKIGLGSESSKPIEDFLKNFEAIHNGYFVNSTDEFILDIDIKDDYEEARASFTREQSKYDIVMLDDPWIPSCEEFIYPIEDTEIFRHYTNKNQAFNGIFYKAFEQVCVGSNGKLLALPIIGNVQMLIFRNDAEKRAIGEILKNPKLDYLINPINEKEKELILNQNQCIDDLCKIALDLELGDAITYRGGIENDVVEVFWELLRRFGCSIEVKDHRVFIDYHKACEALDWMRKLSNIQTYNQLKDRLFAEQPTMIATIGWPSWDCEPKEKLPGFNQIRLSQLSASPVMGAWLLALPKNPLKPDWREYAAQVILTLTANEGAQSILAQQGNVAVIQSLPRPIYNSFWKINYNSIRNAIADSSPRPRTRYWKDIESGLGRQIIANLKNKEGAKFTDIEGKLIFRRES